MKRVMCVYFPSWPLQRVLHERSELQGKPVVLFSRVPARRDAVSSRGQSVLLCSTEAYRSGVRSGMPVAEALSIDPHLVMAEEDPGRDLSVLKRLAQWMERYSPIVGLEEELPPQCLLLDITGCAPCFHGEDRLQQRAMRELTEHGWTARVAVADTIGAAWGLAHHGPVGSAVRTISRPSTSNGPHNGPYEWLHPLPVAALRLPADTCCLLAKLGIERIGQLTALPRSSLSSRFGPAVLQRLDQAIGNLPEAIVPYHATPPVQAVRRFEWPTARREPLEYVLADLAECIQGILKNNKQGARRIECWLYHEAAAPTRLEVNLFRPSNSAAYLCMLLRTRLEQVRIEEPVAMMRLYAPLVESLSDSQSEFFESSRHGDRELSELIDSLGSRLGYTAVTRATPVPDYQPEYACRFEPLVSGGRKSPGAMSRAGHFVPGDLRPPLTRQVGPLRLWPTPVPIRVMSVVPEGPPVQFTWKGTDYRVIHAWGPERIETGWWRHHDVRRDYYVVATQVGSRFWLFRRRDDGRWFVHGCFD